MSICTYTRDTLCKDCLHCRYYYVGNRKLHKCVINDSNTTLRRKAITCINKGVFEWNPSAIPKKL